MKMLLLALALITGSAHADVLEVNPKRNVIIRGAVDMSALYHAEKIVKLADGSGEPIYITINSPGGSVATGSQVITALYIAKIRGHKIICAVPLLAASMGFQILIHCDERYAFRSTLLLFHPMAIGVMGGLTKEQMLYGYRRLRAWEKPFIQDLLAALKIEPRVFHYHYRNETMWMGHEFPELSPGFLTLVDDMRGIPGLFNLGR